MTALVLEARRPRDPLADDGFEVSYVPDGGAEHRVLLAQACSVPLEQGIPVRRFTSWKGQRHMSGLWWSATTGGHVGFVSWLERDHVLHLDFDPSVIGIASQPFWLHWTDAAGTTVSHAPDFFARRSDGSAVVVDCRPVERRRPRDVANAAPKPARSRFLPSTQRGKFTALRGSRPASRGFRDRCGRCVKTRVTDPGFVVHSADSCESSSAKSSPRPGRRPCV
jgi:hypothetical protein